MEVYIVRHGEVLHNVLKQYNAADESLTETGVKQAQELSNIIKNIIVSSPLIRTQQTAKIINVNNKPIIFDERLKERDCGSLSGKPLNITNRDEYWNYNPKKCLNC